VEEIILSLAESGTLAGAKGAYRLARPVDEIEIPATLQPLLAARIDRLAEREKQVLRTASVIGDEFGEKLLTRALELPSSSSPRRCAHSPMPIWPRARGPSTAPPAARRRSATHRHG